MITCAQVRDDLLSKLGIEDFTLADTLALQDCAVAINAALQLLQTSGQDFFTRNVVTVAITAGTQQYVLDDSIQAVIAPIRLNASKPLFSLGSQGEIDQFDRIFNGGSSYGVASGEPIAYWVQSIFNGATTGKMNESVIWLAPIPDANGTMDVEVVNNPRNYDVSDLSDTSAIPVAQNYTESIFLPVARYFVTRSSQFSRPDIMEQINADYQLAIQRLSAFGGFPNVEQPAPARTSQG